MFNNFDADKYAKHNEKIKNSYFSSTENRTPHSCIIGRQDFVKSSQKKMTIDVQCVYGDDDIENVRSCIIPNLAAATKEKVIFLTMNYDAAGKRLDSGDPYGCEVWDIPKTSDGRTGFDEEITTFEDWYLQMLAFLTFGGPGGRYKERKRKYRENFRRL